MRRRAVRTARRSKRQPQTKPPRPPSNTAASRAKRPIAAGNCIKCPVLFQLHFLRCNWTKRPFYIGALLAAGAECGGAPRTPKRTVQSQSARTNGAVAERRFLPSLPRRGSKASAEPAAYGGRLLSILRKEFFIFSARRPKKEDLPSLGDPRPPDSTEPRTSGVGFNAHRVAAFVVYHDFTPKSSSL